MHQTNFKPAALSASQQRKNTKAVRETVWARDGGCRVFGCLSWNALEMAHLKAKGMGGDRGIRTTTRNCAMVCHEHHQGTRSLHSGHIKWRALSNKGADGPLCFEFYEKLPSEL